jgi:SAM-dependent methyltransferase
MAFSTLRQAARALRYVGFQRFCPCCGSHIRGFLPYPVGKVGRVPRANAQCPICGALERHRLIVEYLRERTNFWTASRLRMLHVAPERILASLFRSARHVRYVSMDLRGRRPLVNANLERLPFQDGSFDVIYCSHVLEHVTSDRIAMRELRRVLAPGGWAILQVPIIRETTYEDASITTEAGRLEAFGQHDHVRAYGRDYPDRLAEAGFRVTADEYARTIPERRRKRLGLRDADTVFVCR